MSKLEIDSKVGGADGHSEFARLMAQSRDLMIIMAAQQRMLNEMLVSSRQSVRESRALLLELE